MTTLAQRYIEGMRAALEAAPNFPARVESSPVRAHTRNETAVVSLQLGTESVEGSGTPRVTRSREVHLMVHTAGDEHLALCEGTFEAATPILMQYQAEAIVQIEELRTDEPKYANGDLTRQVVTKRFLVTYQTVDDSLSE